MSARSTSLRVGKLFGALGVNLCSPSEWAYNFEKFDCLVVTAQLVLDSLAHGFLRMEQIALLVFDEAHHAKSNQYVAAGPQAFLSSRGMSEGLLNWNLTVLAVHSPASSATSTTARPSTNVLESSA